MKKILSVVFIAMLLLNVLGYYGVFLGLQYRNDVAMTKVLDDNQYDQSQTITLKIPVSVPYMTDQVDFERVNGKFEHQGEHYRMVKQKYAKDTLTIVCFRDRDTKILSEALSEYVNTFTDNPADASQHTKVTLTFIKDYLPQEFSLTTTSFGWEADVIKYGCYITLLATYSSSVLQPPELA